MYVLKLGSNAITNDTKIMECDNCNSRIIYNEYDIMTGYEMCGSATKYIRCPVCGKYIELFKDENGLVNAFSTLCGVVTMPLEEDNFCPRCGAKME